MELDNIVVRNKMWVHSNWRSIGGIWQAWVKVESVWFLDCFLWKCFWQHGHCFLFLFPFPVKDSTVVFLVKKIPITHEKIFTYSRSRGTLEWTIWTGGKWAQKKLPKKHDKKTKCVEHQVPTWMQMMEWIKNSTDCAENPEQQAGQLQRTCICSHKKFQSRPFQPGESPASWMLAAQNEKIIVAQRENQLFKICEMMSEKHKNDTLANVSRKMQKCDIYALKTQLSSNEQTILFSVTYLNT